MIDNDYADIDPAWIPNGEYMVKLEGRDRILVLDIRVIRDLRGIPLYLKDADDRIIAWHLVQSLEPKGLKTIW